MLDLDAIANRRAGALGQAPEAWRACVWSPAFQTLSARLTDGEVQDLLEMCSSADELVRRTELLMREPIPTELTPLDWLRREIAAGRR